MPLRPRAGEWRVPARDPSSRCQRHSGNRLMIIRNAHCGNDSQYLFSDKIDGWIWNPLRVSRENPSLERRGGQGHTRLGFSSLYQACFTTLTLTASNIFKYLTMERDKRRQVTRWISASPSGSIRCEEWLVSDSMRIPHIVLLSFTRWDTMRTSFHLFQSGWRRKAPERMPNSCSRILDRQ